MDRPDTSPGGQPDSPVDPIRQWMCVPPSPQATSRPRSLQEFRVLLETRRGLLISYAVRQRERPDIAQLRLIAERFESFQESAVQTAHLREMCLFDDLNVTLLDAEFANEANWNLEVWAKMALLDAVADGRVTSISAGRIRDEIIQEQNSWFRANMARFLGGLDREAIGVLRSVGSFRVSLYNFLIGDNEIHRRNRLQALRQYPILYRRILDRDFALIRQVIDDGGSLIDALAHRYVVPRSVVRAVSGTATLVASTPVDRPEIILLLLHSIPPSWWPRSADEWKGFGETARCLAAVSRQPVSTASNRWTMRECARRGYRLPNLESDGWQRARQEIDEFFSGLHKAIQFRLRETHQASGIETLLGRVDGMMLSSLGIDRIAQLARRWGDAYRQAQAEFAAESELWRGARWPSLTAAPICVGQIEAHPLVTARELVDEGRAMRNCVATYASSCMKGRCQIWSMRSADGVRIATLLTSVTRGVDGRPVIVTWQHAGAGNVNPPLISRDAAQILLHEIVRRPRAIEGYLRWKQYVAIKPMDERLAIALVQPIVTSLEEVLPKRWKLERLEAKALQHQPIEKSCLS